MAKKAKGRKLGGKAGGVRKVSAKASAASVASAGSIVSAAGRGDRAQVEATLVSEGEDLPRYSGPTAEEAAAQADDLSVRLERGDPEVVGARIRTGRRSPESEAMLAKARELRAADGGEAYRPDHAAKIEQRTDGFNAELSQVSAGPSSDEEEQGPLTPAGGLSIPGGDLKLGKQTGWTSGRGRQTEVTPLMVENARRRLAEVLEIPDLAGLPDIGALKKQLERLVDRLHPNFATRPDAVVLRALLAGVAAVIQGWLDDDRAKARERLQRQRVNQQKTRTLQELTHGELVAYAAELGLPSRYLAPPTTRADLLKRCEEELESRRSPDPVFPPVTAT